MKHLIKVLLCGCCGKMGQVIFRLSEQNESLSVICGVDAVQKPLPFPVYSSFGEVQNDVDVLIDFSHPSCLDSLLAYAVAHQKPVVIATTGYSEEQIQKIRATAEKIPIFFTFNLSLGINLLCSLAKKAAALLGDDYDVEIIEKHHNQKIDAPSGTALMLANAINETLGERCNFEYDRHSKRHKRTKNEIGIHSIRGGTIVGEHEILFAGHDETISLSHSAASKEVFASGALKAAAFLVGKPAGLYDMSQLV